ncbi:formate dehydrogenase accessory sulfurtransferase FdhD [Novosphingopyxis sp.]|uniref:formate dehydrogenase accessory sulfurtransferase FdhD n=1 Tax=Novosphingopyxis sp. TaxID=2709690 RepID=UPI003B5C9852
MSEQRSFAVTEMRFDGGEDRARDRAVPVETPVAIEVNGLGYAVMMATPADLTAFATGFALSEGLAERAADVRCDIAEVEGGWIARLRVPPVRADIVRERQRARMSESSCGLCGLENIAAVHRALPELPDGPNVSRVAIARALESLRDWQPLNRETGAVHAAALASFDGEILAAFEDVGRHNAMDKLIGALALDGVKPSTGIVLLSSRCSYEIVEKCVAAGAGLLVTISAPTSLAVERAKLAKLTLVALARRDSMLVLNDPYGRLS